MDFPLFTTNGWITSDDRYASPQSLRPQSILWWRIKRMSNALNNNLYWFSLLVHRNLFLHAAKITFHLLLFSSLLMKRLLKVTNSSAFSKQYAIIRVNLSALEIRHQIAAQYNSEKKRAKKVVCQSTERWS